MELNGTLNGDQIDVLSMVYLVLLTPSVIGSFSVLVVSIIRWRHLKEQVHLLVQLALADLLAALILMSTTVMNKFSIDNSIKICQYSLPLSLTFYFISFLLVVVYAWKSKNVIQGWRAMPVDDEVRQSHCGRKIIAIPAYAMVWLIPIGIYLAYVLTPFIKTTELIPLTARSTNGIFRNDSTFCTSCILFLHVWRDSCSDAVLNLDRNNSNRTGTFMSRSRLTRNRKSATSRRPGTTHPGTKEIIHDMFIRVFLVLMVILVMSSCSIIYYQVGKWYERHQHQGLFPVEGDGRSRRRYKRMFSTARNMVAVILFCWAPALLLILLSTLMIKTHVQQRSLFGLYVIQAASVSLQGFLNSVVYAWRRPNFTEAVLGENTPLVTHDRLAFFDESLRNSSYG